MAGHLTDQNAIKRIRRRRKHFLRKRKFGTLLEEAGHLKVGLALRDCQETELLAYCPSCSHRWYVLNRCRTRVCPLCSFDTSLKRAKYLKHLTKHMAYPKMLTLTMPVWKGDPADGIKHLRDSFAALRRRPVFAGVRGGAYQIEVKIKPAGFHIHMHAMIDAPYIPYQRIFSAWRAVVGVDVPQIDIRSTNDPKALAYVVKYATKSADFDRAPENVVRWYEATKGQRLFATFGKWYNVTIEELDPDHPEASPGFVCPHCKATSGVFLARDGPFIMGAEAWATIARTLLPNHPDTRPLAGAKLAVETPLTEAEKKEFMPCRKTSRSKSSATSQAEKSTTLPLFSS